MECLCVASHQVFSHIIVFIYPALKRASTLLAASVSATTDVNRDKDTVRYASCGFDHILRQLYPRLNGSERHGRKPFLWTHIGAPKTISTEWAILNDIVPHH